MTDIEITSDEGYEADAKVILAILRADRIQAVRDMIMFGYGYVPCDQAKAK